MRTIKIFGPPGTGKTRALTGLALKAVERYGGSRVCAITFTRAGADELKARIALGLGLHVPSDPWQRRKALDHALPHMGTIHSLAFKLIGRPPVMQRKHFQEFAGMRTAGLPDSDELEGYEWSTPSKDGTQAALAVHAMARHRLLPFDEAYRTAPWSYAGPSVSLDQAQKIALDYEDYKRSKALIDFEDMLLLGSHEYPEVDVLLADEVQDNSPLLWTLVDTWSAGKDTALAGDPYQAIYIFSGASPSLFMDHPGELVRLGDSHRLTPHASDFAQGILARAGYQRGEWLGSWTGLGSGEAAEGTEFYLARTARLLGPVYDQLQAEGRPYGHLRGGGPLQSRQANAFRTIIELRERGSAPVGAISQLAQAMDKGWLPASEKTRLSRAARADPESRVALEDVCNMWDVSPERLSYGLALGDYFRSVLAHHGKAAFVLPPATLVGTIHAAKGKEADRVHLVESWGTLPYKNITAGMAREEACVAYVGATRHRSRLYLEPAMEGYPYPW